MENSSTSRSRYSSVAILLHWLIAIGVIANWRIAEAAEHLPEAERGAVMGWHFAFGMSILVLTVLRLIWRLIHRPPPLQASLARWEVLLAKSVHGIFYVLLIGLPLGGWIGMSGYGFPVNMFGIVWPVLPVGFGEETGHEILEVHATIGSIMILLVGLHILAVLKHTFYDKTGNIFRMLPFGTAKD